MTLSENPTKKKDCQCRHGKRRCRTALGNSQGVLTTPLHFVSRDFGQSVQADLRDLSGPCQRGGGGWHPAMYLVVLSSAPTCRGCQGCGGLPARLEALCHIYFRAGDETGKDKYRVGISCLQFEAVEYPKKYSNQ